MLLWKIKIMLLFHVQSLSQEQLKKLSYSTQDNFIMEAFLKSNTDKKCPFCFIGGNFKTNNSLPILILIGKR